MDRDIRDRGIRDRGTRDRGTRDRDTGKETQGNRDTGIETQGREIQKNKGNDTMGRNKGQRQQNGTPINVKFQIYEVNQILIQLKQPF